MDPEIEKQLRQLRNHIYIDETFKQSLRKDFLKKRKKPIWKMPWVAVSAAAIVFLAILITSFQVEHTNASSLNVANSISFFDVGEGEITAYSHYQGNLYVSIKNKGIYLNSSGDFEKITTLTADSMNSSVNEEGLLLTNGGSIYILHPTTKAAEEIKAGSYSHPAWKDSKTIFAEKNNTIVEIDLQTLKEKQVTEGTMPSYIKEEKKLVFARDGAIILRDRNGRETKADDGTDPAVSAQGGYFSYVKEEEGVENVWIADTDLKTRKKATANFVNAVERTKGIYQYSLPVWHSAANSLFVLKNNGQENSVKLMKISLSDKELTASATVERFLQALIVRDDDYAKSMMDNPPEFLTYSNPYQIGFEVLNAKIDGDLTNVTAKVYWTYTANPYYKISAYEFELVKKEHHYVIAKVTEKDAKELADLENNGVIEMIKSDQKEKLFSIDDVPKEWLGRENIRISSLVMDPDGEKIIFSLQEMTERPNLSGVTFIEYDLSAKTFKKLIRLDPENSRNDIVIRHLSIDPSGQYIAADLFSGEQPEVVIFDIKQVKQVANMHGAASVFWQGEQLIIEKWHENQSTLYRFNPQTGEKKYF